MTENPDSATTTLHGNSHPDGSASNGSAADGAVDHATDGTAEATQSEQSEANGQSNEQTDQIHLALPASPAYVSVLRSITAALAARIDFTIDEIEDLRIAVDEASALLLAQATDDTPMSCHFRLTGDELSFSVSVESTRPRMPPHDSFAWTVLTALVRDVDADVDTARNRAALTLAKRAEAVRQSATGSGTSGASD